MESRSIEIFAERRKDQIGLKQSSSFGLGDIIFGTFRCGRLSLDFQEILVYLSLQTLLSSCLCIES